MYVVRKGREMWRKIYTTIESRRQAEKEREGEEDERM